MRLTPLLIRVAVCGCLAIAACVPAAIRLGTPQPTAEAREQAAEHRVALEALFRDQDRLDDVGQSLVVAAAPFCTPTLTPALGIRLANARQYNTEWQPAARDFGLGDSLIIQHVASASPAALAGVRSGDHLLRINAVPSPTGSSAVEQASTLLARSAVASGAVDITVPNDSTDLTLRVRAESACDFPVIAQTSAMPNAFENGRAIVVTSAMLRFIQDDEELAVLLAHEIAHNALGHVDGKRASAALGEILRAIADVSIGQLGIERGSELAPPVWAASASPYPEELEREADYVALYILASAGHPLDAAPRLWRRVASAREMGVLFGAAHPSTPERYARLQRGVEEIERRLSRGEPLRPERARDALAAAREASSTAQPPASAAGTRQGPPVSAPAPIALPESAEPRRPVPLNPQLHPVIDPAIRRTAARIAYREARSAMDRHEWKKAESLFREAVKLDESDPRYVEGVGDVLIVVGRFQDAEEIFNQLVLAHPLAHQYRAKLLEAKRRQQ